MSAGHQLRSLLAREEILVLPGAYDALSARVLDKLSFGAVYVSGFGVSASLLGLPDAGFLSFTDVEQTARRICRSVDVPVVVDADTGFGNAVQVIRTVREIISIGAAGVQLEDQVAPKRCGHIAGKQIISLEEALGKIRAAVDAREQHDPAFLIVARTDARGIRGGSLEVAIERGNAFAEVGADLVFVEGLLSEDEIGEAATELDVPLVYNVTGVSPKTSLDRLESLGVKVALFPGMLIRAAVLAMWDAAEQLAEKGTEADVEVREALKRSPIEEMYKFVAFPALRELEARYLPEEELAKYEGSTGYGS